MNRRIGLFPGSFNPIHVGHLILASYIKEFTDLDEIWFVVSPRNPGKDTDELLDGNLRLKMAKMALGDWEGLKVSDIEFHMPLPSYTIDTIIKLTYENPDKEFTLIIGADKWTRLSQWKGAQQLRHEFNILIYPRFGSQIDIPEKFRENIHLLVEAPIMEISSTFIRKSLREGKDVCAFVPRQAYDFIRENGYYR